MEFLTIYGTVLAYKRATGKKIHFLQQFFSIWGMGECSLCPRPAALRVFQHFSKICNIKCRMMKIRYIYLFTVIFLLLHRPYSQWILKIRKVSNIGTWFYKIWRCLSSLVLGGVSQTPETPAQDERIFKNRRIGLGRFVGKPCEVESNKLIFKEHAVVYTGFSVCGGCREQSSRLGGGYLFIVEIKNFAFFQPRKFSKNV